MLNRIQKLTINQKNAKYSAFLDHNPSYPSVYFNQRVLNDIYQSFTEST
jgi:hypothetical protein